jgi:ribosome-associated protein
LQPKRIVSIAREAADAKQAVEPVVLDISRLTQVAHYFLITHGNSDRHVRAIAENIELELEKKGIPVWHLEGLGEGRWVVLDYGSVIVHVFYREMRQFYGLERLWGAAPQLKAK